MKSRHSGHCPHCGHHYPQGTPLLRREPHGWVHDYCADFLDNRTRVNSGASFASQRTSTWKRKNSPGSFRTPR